MRNAQRRRPPQYLLMYLFGMVRPRDEGTANTSSCWLNRILDTFYPRQQQMLRLRYDLDQEQGYPRSGEEVAQMLGIMCRSVTDAEQRGLGDLRTYQIRHYGQRSPRSFSDLAIPMQSRKHHLQQQHGAQTARLQAAYEHLQAQGVSPTCKALAALAHVDAIMVKSFLCEHREGTEQERLQNAYNHLCTQGQLPTANMLCHLAQVAIPVACAFLQAQTSGQGYTEMCAEERLSRTYTHLQTQGEAISVSKLRALAQVGHEAARQFLRSRSVPPGKPGRPRIQAAAHEAASVFQRA